MGDSTTLEVVTPTRKVVEVVVSEVQLPAADGEIGVLPGHTPLLTVLGTGELRYRGPGIEGWLAVQGGFAEVLGDRVTVLAEVAERPEEIDVAAAQELRSQTEAGLRTATLERFEELSASHRLAVTRLAVAARKKT